MTTLAKGTAKSGAGKRAPAQVVYLYAISRMPERRVPAIAAEGVNGSSPVEAVRCDDVLCWISRVAKSDFADHIVERMDNLEWLSAAGLRHQRVVGEIAGKLPTLPARFATVFLNQASLEKHVDERRDAIHDAFARVADADEWGIKVFALAPPKLQPVKAASSGSEYLKRKAKMLQPRSRGKLEAELEAFVAALKDLAAADGPGGKASAGQPGLVWHGSFLVRRHDRKKLEATLLQYAKQWHDMRRIDCSGPWPPYSFVGEDV